MGFSKKIYKRALRTENGGGMEDDFEEGQWLTSRKDLKNDNCMLKVESDSSGLQMENESQLH